MDVTIYFNPQCNTSLMALAIIEAAGIEPTVINYLKTPPSREKLVELIGQMRIPVRDLVRPIRTPYGKSTYSERWTDDELIDLMVAHPAIAYRPIVITSIGTKLCRPAETVLEILPGTAPVLLAQSEIVLPTKPRSLLQPGAARSLTKG